MLLKGRSDVVLQALVHITFHFSLILKGNDLVLVQQLVNVVSNYFTLPIM